MGGRWSCSVFIDRPLLCFSDFFLFEFFCACGVLDVSPRLKLVAGALMSSQFQTKHLEVMTFPFLILFAFLYTFSSMYFCARLFLKHIFQNSFSHHGNHHPTISGGEPGWYPDATSTLQHRQLRFWCVRLDKFAVCQ